MACPKSGTHRGSPIAYLLSSHGNTGCFLRHWSWHHSTSFCVGLSPTFQPPVASPMLALSIFCRISRNASASSSLHIKPAMTSCIAKVTTSLPFPLSCWALINPPIRIYCHTAISYRGRRKPKSPVGMLANMQRCVRTGSQPRYHFQSAGSDKALPIGSAVHSLRHRRMWCWRGLNHILRWSQSVASRVHILRHRRMWCGTAIKSHSVLSQTVDYQAWGSAVHSLRHRRMWCWRLSHILRWSQSMASRVHILRHRRMWCCNGLPRPQIHCRPYVHQASATTECSIGIAKPHSAITAIYGLPSPHFAVSQNVVFEVENDILRWPQSMASRVHTLR